MPALIIAGFKCFRPRGAYYVMTDISAFGFKDDIIVRETSWFRKSGWLACRDQVSIVDPRDGAKQVRFAFCKRPETLSEAAKKLSQLQIKR